MARNRRAFTHPLRLHPLQTDAVAKFDSQTQAFTGKTFKTLIPGVLGWSIDTFCQRSLLHVVAEDFESSGHLPKLGAWSLCYTCALLIDL